MPDKSAVEVIAGAMAAHNLGMSLYESQEGFFYKCACGERMHIENGTPSHRDHVAAEIDKALGGLTRELRINAMSSAGCTTDTKTGETTWHSDIRRDARWIGGWTSMEHGTEAPD